MEKLRSWLYIKTVNDYKSKGTCGVMQDIELFRIRHISNKIEWCVLFALCTKVPAALLIFIKTI